MEEVKNNQQQGSGAEELSQKLADCERERDEYLAGWQRAKADFVNYKKEEIARLEEFAKYGSEAIVADLIGVLDSFDLAISYFEKRPAPTPDGASGSESRPEGVGLEAPRPTEGMEKGIYMIHSQIGDILKKRGVEKIEVKTGDEFNPSFMEAVAEMESDKPPGTVLEEIERGWKMHDKILRPARVKVAKA